jgi:hypothetical protein
LDYNPCVNEEVRKFNRSLINVAKNLNKVTVVNAYMEREYHTRHGLHLNGKENINCNTRNNWVADKKCCYSPDMEKYFAGTY